MRLLLKSFFFFFFQIDTAAAAGRPHERRKTNGRAGRAALLFNDHYHLLLCVNDRAEPPRPSARHEGGVRMNPFRRACCVCGTCRAHVCRFRPATGRVSAGKNKVARVEQSKPSGHRRLRVDVHAYVCPDEPALIDYRGTRLRNTDIDLEKRSVNRRRNGRGRTARSRGAFIVRF